MVPPFLPRSALSRSAPWHRRAGTGRLTSAGVTVASIAVAPVAGLLRSVLVTVVSLAACAGETVTIIEPVEPGPLYWELTLNQPAINLSVAPYDTFRLVATPRRLDGTPIAGLPAPTFTSGDPNQVQMGPDGLVRGVGEATRVPIIVTLTDTATDLTHQDTALVSVTTNPTPPVLDSLSFETLVATSGVGLAPFDSAKGTVYGGFYWPGYILNPRAFDLQGNSLSVNRNQSSSLIVAVESSDPTIVEYDLSNDGVLKRHRPGPVNFYARTWAYGVARVDTLEYVVGLPLVRIMVVQTQVLLGRPTPTYRLFPSSVTIATGGYVWWFREGATPAYDVTFKDPTHVAADMTLVAAQALYCGEGNAAGNIVPFDDPTNNGPDDFNFERCGRHFPVAGTYPFQSVGLNASGTIVVEDERPTATAGAAVTWSPAALQPAARSAALPAGPGRLRVVPAASLDGVSPPLAWP